MNSEKEALEAKTALDNYKIFDDESYINIFFSNLETLNLNSTTIDGKGSPRPPHILYLKKNSKIIQNQTQFSKQKISNFLLEIQNDPSP